jgi:signal transduction histidine kinase
VATEQEEAVGRVQESVRLMLAEIGQHLATCLVDAPDTAWRHRFEDLLHMTGQASGQVRHAQAIAQSLPMQGDDLDSSLRALIRAVATDTGLAVKLRIEGEGRALTFARRDALFQVAIAALFTAGQQARASYAVVALTYGKGEVRLAVRDDGVDPARRDLFSNRAMGVRGAQQRVHAVGGQLRVRGLQPRGASVEATVPTRRGPGGGPRQ